MVMHDVSISLPSLVNSTHQLISAIASESSVTETTTTTTTTTKLKKEEDTENI